MERHFRKSTRAFSGLAVLTDKGSSRLHKYFNTAGEGAQEGILANHRTTTRVELYTTPKFDKVGA